MLAGNLTPRGQKKGIRYRGIGNTYGCELVAQILIGLYNKNLESDIGINAERSEKSQSLVLSFTKSSDQREPHTES